MALFIILLLDKLNIPLSYIEDKNHISSIFTIGFTMKQSLFIFCEFLRSPFSHFLLPFSSALAEEASIADK